MSNHSQSNRPARAGALVIGEGNLEYRIDIKGDDEFAELSETFDAMTAKLRETYLKLENEVKGVKNMSRSFCRLVIPPREPIKQRANSSPT